MRRSPPLNQVCSGFRPKKKKKVCRGPEKHLELGRCLTEEDLRRVVREEVERANASSADCNQRCAGNDLEEIKNQMRRMKKILREAAELVKIISPHAARSSGTCQKNDEVRNLKLQIKDGLSLPLFTGQKLEGEHGGPIIVELINANTGAIVESGPESSVKLVVVVLDGDFKKEVGDNWTREEFEKYIVKEREGKRPLLTGNLEVILKAGTGVLDDLEFTDNSSWTRSRKFTIGLQVSPGNRENICICEAITEAFTVKEHRGELNKKHEPPESDDDVWRLKTIGREGAFHKRLNDAGINTVEEVLLQHFMDSNKLKNTLGKNMTKKKWKVLLDHAKTCPQNGKSYMYYHDNQSDCGVIFNNYDKVRGLFVDGTYCAPGSFSPQQKDYADGLVKRAHENWKDVTQFNTEASSSCSFPPKFLGDQQCRHPVYDNMPPPESSAFAMEGNGGIATAELIQSQIPQNATWNQTTDSFPPVDPWGQFGSSASFLVVDAEDEIDYRP